MKNLYTTILCLAFFYTNAQVAPLLEPNYWTIEKVVFENDTTYADTNNNDEYEKLFVEGSTTSTGIGSFNFILLDIVAEFDDTNQSFESISTGWSFEDVPEGITEAGLLFMNPFVEDDETLIIKDPFTYAFREEDDKIYLDITNSEGDVATFWTSTLSTPNFQEIEFSFYPNPVKDRLYIESPQSEIQKIQIFDINGKQVLQSDSIVQNTIDVSNLKSGIYLLQVETKEGKATRKLVKE